MKVVDGAAMVAINDVVVEVVEKEAPSLVDGRAYKKGFHFSCMKRYSLRHFMKYVIFSQSSSSKATKSSSFCINSITLVQASVTFA
jgi:hypothetical protein